MDVLVAFISGAIVAPLIVLPVVWMLERAAAHRRR
jgi:hypothetical protein